MIDQGRLNSEEIQMQGLLNGFLRLRGGLPASDGPHLDEDSLSAFVEGKLGERENMPIVGHLAECGFCRNVTAELIRLDLAFADGGALAAPRVSEPKKVSEVLSGILSQIFGASDGAVFAHQQPEDEEKDKPEEK